MTYISLIVPTYNEAENLPQLVRRVHSAMGNHSYELIIVDDDSPDGTSRVAEDLKSSYPIKLVTRKHERGLASAVTTGFSHASGTVLGVIDADLQHPPECISRMLEEIFKGADVVVASRYSPGGGAEGLSLVREMGSRTATLLGQFLLISARKTPDPLSGFFFLRKAVIEGVDLKPVGYKILLEILARGKPQQVVSVPYQFLERKAGNSKLGLREQINYLRHIVDLAKAERQVLRFLQFGLVGLSGVFVNLGLLWVLKEAIGLHYLVGAAIAIEISVLSNFTFNHMWTFSDRRTGGSWETLRCMTKFNFVSLAGLSINLGLLWVLTSLVGVHYLLSGGIGIGAATVWNFTINTRWTWSSVGKRELHMGLSGADVRVPYPTHTDGRGGPLHLS